MARDQILYGSIELPNVLAFSHPRDFGLDTKVFGSRIGGKSGWGKPRPLAITVQGLWVIDDPETNAGGDNADNAWALFASSLRQSCKHGDVPLYLQTGWQYPCRLAAITPQEMTWSHVTYDATFICDKGRRFSTTLTTATVNDDAYFTITSPEDTLVYIDIATTSGQTYTIQTNAGDGTITINATATGTLTLDMENHRAFRGAASARQEVKGNFPEIEANVSYQMQLTNKASVVVRYYPATL